MRLCLQRPCSAFKVRETWLVLSLTAKQGEVLWPHYIQGSLLFLEPTLWSLSCCLNPEWLRGAMWLEETAHWTASVDPRLCPDSP